MNAKPALRSLLLLAALAGGVALPPAVFAAPAARTAAPAKPTPYVMTGVVRDAQGRPVAGAEVFADNTLYYNANAVGKTDAQGRYRIELPRQGLGTWAPGAYIKREYRGVFHEFRLYPDDERPFSASEGAVRDFVWRLTGRRGDGLIGKTVYVYTTEGVSLSQVEVTLTPNGPLVDGSAGKPITRSAASGRVDDVPVGRYTMTARLVRPGAAPVPLLVSPGQGGAWGSSATADFEKSNYGVTMEFSVKAGAAKDAPRGDAGTGSISGTLRAKGDLAGTVVLACAADGDGCDADTQRRLTVQAKGRAVPYRFDGLPKGRAYRLFAWKDVNGNGRVDAGDLVGVFGLAPGAVGAAGEVAAPRDGADVELAPAE